MRHTLWSYSRFPSLGVDAQVNSVHRLRCMLDRNHVKRHDRQSTLDGCQLMRDLKEEQPKGTTQRPCGIREESTMPRNTSTLLPRCSRSTQAGHSHQHLGDTLSPKPQDSPCSLLSHTTLTPQLTLRAPAPQVHQHVVISISAPDASSPLIPRLPQSRDKWLTS